MPTTFDVLVIGGGVAGFAAALAAQQNGARVALVRAAPGLTATTSGAWLGPLRAEIRTALERAGYTLLATSSPLAHERGRTIAAGFAAASHVGAVPDASVTICGVAGLPHFNAPILARVWNSDGCPSIEIELPGTPTAGWTSAALAAHIERDPRMIVQALNGQMGRIIFPAVLGIEHGQNVLSALSAAGVEASEALAASPSLPGWRLQSAMERALQASGITLLNGRALAGTANGRVHTVNVNGDVVTAKSFVLATGKFTAGGIAANDEFREGVFNLPVWLEHLGDVFSTFDPLPLTDPVRTEDQPLLRAGVHTDDRGRPVNRAERVIYDNVFVAGTIRAGVDAAHAGLGLCADDGWNAGVNATT
jgi:glycerol-3-phosphate dehydrogenase subunit B